MTLNCADCGKRLKDGDLIEGIFRAYYHEIPSKVFFSITKPHDYLKETVMHVDCGEYR